MGAERIGDTGSVGSKGKYEVMFATRLLTTTFSTGCNDLGAARNSDLDSSLEGREGAARIGIAGAGSLTAASHTGKRLLAFVRPLLIAAFLIGCCIGLYRRRW